MMYNEKNSPISKGVFGRLFPKLTPQMPFSKKNEKLLSILAKQIYSNGGGGQTSKYFLAGYTYFGQFLMHDISQDLSKIKFSSTPNSINNFSTPKLDLNLLYGGGPTIQPYLFKPDKIRFRIGKPKCDYPKTNIIYFDLPRVDEPPYNAIIPDSRNDKNVIVSQIHLAFIRFHNAIASNLLAPLQNQIKSLYHHKKYKEIEVFYEGIFTKTRKLVIWHYQWLVLYDYLPRILDLSVFIDTPNLQLKLQNEEVEKRKCIRQQINYFIDNFPRLQLHNWSKHPFIPLEFSAAIGRFGHSQARVNYFFNKDNPYVENLKPLFPKEFRSDKRIRQRLDWRLFFAEREETNKAGLIEPVISHNLEKLPEIVNAQFQNLAYINLMRGLVYQLPSGQDLARQLKIQPISPNKIPLSNDLKSMKESTPLWYYMLVEAKEKQNGERLGPVGSRILLEVIIGLMMADKSSFIHQNPTWKPSLENQNKPVETMKDLLVYTTIYEPETIP